VPTLPVHLVAAPVLERLAGPGARSGAVLGAGATAAWVDLDGFVVAVTTREVPLLPNAVALAGGSGSLQRAGAAAGRVARFAPGRIDLGTVQVTWDPAAPPAWDPTVPKPTDAGPEALARRAAAILGALGGRGSAPPGAVGGAVDNRRPASRGSATLPLQGPRQPRVGLESARLQMPQPPRLGLEDAQLQELRQPRVGLEGAWLRELARIGVSTAADPDGGAALAGMFRAVGERDPEPAARAARGLLGRGPGLTPEGDDLLAAVAGTLAVLGPAAGWDRSALTGFLAALVAPAPGRTTALSATLLELAALGQLAEPAGRLLDLGPDGEAAWPAALTRLKRLGHGSGLAYAAGIAATAGLLAGSPFR
jgi:uncharacterized protein DUF2877